MMANYSPTARRTGQRCLYSALCSTFCLLRIAFDVYLSVRFAQAVPKIVIDIPTSAKCHFFPAGKPVVFVVADTVGLFPTAVKRSQYVFVDSTRYFKLVQTIPTHKSIATHIANPFTNYWLFPKRFSNFLPTSREIQLVC